VFPRAVAARAMRYVTHDPIQRIRRLANHVLTDLHLEEPAPPTAVRARATGSQQTPTLRWAFGIFPTEMVVGKKTKAKKPARPVLDLPKLADRAAIAKLVGVASADELSSFMRAGTGPGSGYVEFEIPKAKGGSRRIAAPRTPLRRVQRAILDKILAVVPMHDACHGFVAGRSTVTNATPHQNARLVLKLDLKDFFPTVHYARVKGLFRMLGYAADVAGVLAGLTTYRPKLDNGDVLWPGVLPQGAPTSPALANLCCRRLDARLSKLAAACSATYTRYADDLTFSFRADPPADFRIGRFLWWIDAICHDEGFLERPDKRRILRAKHQQRVTGIVVNAGVHVPRADRKRFRAILHNCEKHGFASQARGRDDFASYLAGYAAYVHMVEPELGRAWIARVEKILEAAGG
jgi:hypothetical protein